MAEDVYRVIPLDPSTVRDAAVLRLIGAAICVAMAIWLGVLRPSWRIGIWAVAGLAVAAFWVRRFGKSRRTLRRADRCFVALEPERLRVGRGGEDTLEIGWDEVTGVDVDEERLEVRVTRDGADPVYIEPVYGGLGVYELAEAVQRAHEASRA